MAWTEGGAAEGWWQSVSPFSRQKVVVRVDFKFFGGCEQLYGTKRLVARVYCCSERVSSIMSFTFFFFFGSYSMTSVNSLLFFFFSKAYTRLLTINLSATTARHQMCHPPMPPSGNSRSARDTYAMEEAEHHQQINASSHFTP